MHSPCKVQMEVVLKILRYLKRYPKSGMLFSNNYHLQVEAYSDVDWVGSVSHKRLHLGIAHLLKGNLITWKSKKQSVARSNVEAQLRTMMQGICELMWLKILLKLDNKKILLIILFDMT
ncbi:hypothetical protein ACOSP7_004819 [Xanthoceras sorbifolium]